MIPRRLMEGVCEISTGTLMITSMPPAYTGEIATLEVSVQFQLEGAAYDASGAVVQMYLYYPGKNQMTGTVTMTTDGDTASGVLDIVIGGCPLLVIQMTDEDSGALIIACTVSLAIQRVRGDTVIMTRTPTPSEVVYVGRAPYISAQNTWMIWDNNAAQYVDSGVSVIGPQGLPGELRNLSDELPKAPAAQASAGTSSNASRDDHVHPEQTDVTGNAGTADKLRTARQIGSASFDGSADITLEEIGAYARNGIRRISIAVAVSDWTGTGPYTATISRADVTEETWVDIRFDAATAGNQRADIEWSTEPGQITLTTDTLPAGTLSGQAVMMEVG